MAFLLCVGFCDYSVMRKVGSSVGCPLTGRYVLVRKIGRIMEFLTHECSYLRACNLNCVSAYN